MVKSLGVHIKQNVACGKSHDVLALQQNLFEVICQAGAFVRVCIFMLTLPSHM